MGILYLTVRNKYKTVKQRVCVYVCVCGESERERERNRATQLYMYLFVIDWTSIPHSGRCPLPRYNFLRLYKSYFILLIFISFTFFVDVQEPPWLYVYYVPVKNRRRD